MDVTIINSSEVPTAAPGVYRPTQTDLICRFHGEIPGSSPRPLFQEGLESSSPSNSVIVMLDFQVSLFPTFGGHYGRVRRKGALAFLTSTHV